VAVEKGDKIYLHITNPKAVKNQVELKGFPYQIKKAYRFENGENIMFAEGNQNNEIKLQITGLDLDDIDQVIVLEIKK
jgi:hypothetical protein